MTCTVRIDRANMSALYVNCATYAEGRRVYDKIIEQMRESKPWTLVEVRFEYISDGNEVTEEHSVPARIIRDVALVTSEDMGGRM